MHIRICGMRARARVYVCVCVCVCVYVRGQGGRSAHSIRVPRGMTSQGGDKRVTEGRAFIPSLSPIYYLLSPIVLEFSLSHPLRSYYSRSLFLPLRSLFLLRFNFIK